MSFRPCLTIAHRFTRGAVIWPLVIAVTIAEPALAQQPAVPPVASETAPPAPAPTAPAEADTSPADKQANTGRQAYRAGDYKLALKSFQAAFEIEKRPAFLYNVARVEEKLARYRDAVKHLEQYLALYKRQNAGADSPNQTDVNNLIRNLKSRAYQTLPTVRIQSDPPGAQVIKLLDNSTLGSTPIKTHLEPGSYRLRLTLKGHTDLEVNLIVPETGEVNAVFSLQSKVQMAAISVWCNIRRVKVAIDGKVVAMTPLSGSIQVAPGRHQIALTREGYGLIEEFVEVPENREMHLRYTLYPIATTRTWRTVVGWPALIGGLVGIGAGVFSMTRANTYFTGSPDFDRWQGYQNLGYGAGGGLTGIGFGLLLWDAVRVNVPEEDLVGGRQFQPGRTLRPLRPETRSRR